MKVLVPCDFTKVVPAAMSYAVKMSTVGEVEIDLLHVYESGARLSRDQAKEHLESAAKEYEQTFGVKVNAMLVNGTIEKTIAAVAGERRAEYVVMGTHGINGMQRFFGSKAIKVVIDSVVPFLVVQAPAPEQVFRRLIMPVGWRHEDMEKMTWCVHLVKEYSCELHVVPAYFADPKFQQKQSVNLALLERLCIGNGLRYEIHPVAKGKKLESELERVGREKQCDWMLIMITQSVAGISAALNSIDQDFMANPLGIPVMCVNPTMAPRW